MNFREHWKALVVVDGETQTMRSYFVRIAFALAIVFPPLAGSAQPFDSNAFHKTVAAGKTTLIHATP